VRRCYACGSLSSLTAGPVTVVAACEAAQPRSPPRAHGARTRLLAACATHAAAPVAAYIPVP